MKKHSVLIIDSNKEFSMSLKRCLEIHNYLAIVPNNIFETLEVLRKNPPDLIILDILINEVDGFVFLDKIRNGGFALSYIPIVILTTKAKLKSRIQGYRLGCNAYISKPFNKEELLSIIENLIRQHEYYNYFSFHQKFNNNVSSNVYKDIKVTQTPLAKSFETNRGKIEFTIREQSILDLIIVGKMNKEIALSLRMSTRNVEKYVTRLLHKMDLQTRTELARYALCNCLCIRYL